MVGRKTVVNVSRAFLFVALTVLLSCGEKGEKGKNGIITGYVVAEQKAGLAPPDTLMPLGNGNEVKPVPGAKVKVESVEVKKEGKADENGKFEIEVPRGHYNLIAEMVRQDGKKFNALIGVDVEEGKVVEVGQVVIKEAGAIYGVARLSDKSPGYYKGIVVYIMATGMFALTDENGAYALPGVPSGTYTLRFDMVGYKEKEVEGIVVESGKATKVDDVILDVDEQEIINKGIVGGTVKDAQTSSPISGALISVKGLGVSSVSLDDGSYQIAIDPGTYKLLAIADGYGMAEIEVKVLAGETIQADIILNPSSEYGIATLKGKVIDGTNGNPVFSAVVLSSPSRGQTYTDTNGTFSLNLPVGCYTITFAKGGYEETKISVCLDSGMKVDLGNIALYPSGGGCFAETEICDGKDNDCDGEVDEGCGGINSNKIAILFPNNLRIVKFGTLIAEGEHSDPDCTSYNYRGYYSTAAGYINDYVNATNCGCGSACCGCSLNECYITTPQDDFLASVIKEAGYTVDVYSDPLTLPNITSSDYGILIVEDPITQVARKFPLDVDDNLPDLLESVTSQVVVDKILHYFNSGGNIILVGDAVRLLENSSVSGKYTLNFGKTVNTYNIPNDALAKCFLPSKWFFIKGNPFCCVDRGGSANYYVHSTAFPLSTTHFSKLTLFNDYDTIEGFVWSETIYYPSDGISLLDVRMVGSGNYVTRGNVCNPTVYTVNVNSVLPHFMGYTIFNSRKIYYIGSDTFFEILFNDYDGNWHCSGWNYIKYEVLQGGREAIIKLIQTVLGGQ